MSTEQQLRERIAELEAQLEAVGAGGVQPLVPQQAAQEPYGWAVAGLDHLYRGGRARADAESEAKNLGRWARVFPLYTAPQQAAPAEIGDSRFEGWYSNYSPEHKSAKQQARDAYAAGMADPLVTAPQQAAQEPYGWAVTGLDHLYRGDRACEDAEAEAKKCGRWARAFPLYTAPQQPGLVPLADVLARVDACAGPGSAVRLALEREFGAAP